VAMSRSRIYPLLAEEPLQARIRELGAEIARDYAGKDLVVIGLLNGVYMFFSDLTRSMDLDFEVTFMQVASYGAGTESTGEVKILHDLDRSIRGRHALVVEDIVDTGNTVKHILDALADHHPASVSVATLLFKPDAYKQDIPIEHVAVRIPNAFVVGSGLDHDGLGRNLPGILRIIS